MTTAIAGLIAVLGTTGLAQWYKNVQVNYTKNQVHTAVCIVAGAITIIWAYATNEPSFMTWLEHALTLATASIGTFELVFSKVNSTLSGTSTPTTPPSAV